ncbi:MAG: hypothetical protein EBZ60_08130 [Betaproteobacteria bacterium]|nr:hypothetical protein [Betaproteobacteria bacterium]
MSGRECFLRLVRHIESIERHLNDGPVLMRRALAHAWLKAHPDKTNNEELKELFKENYAAAVEWLSTLPKTWKLSSVWQPSRQTCNCVGCMCREGHVPCDKDLSFAVMVVLNHNQHTHVHTVQFLRGSCETPEVMAAIRKADMFGTIVAMTSMSPAVTSVLAKEIPMWQAKGMGARPAFYVSKDMAVFRRQESKFVMCGYLQIAHRV